MAILLLSLWQYDCMMVEDEDKKEAKKETRKRRLTSQ